MMRRTDRREFWRALVEAAGNEPGSMFANRIPLIHGMRAIRDFERVNRVRFNPRDRLHRSKTWHMGRFRVGAVLIDRMAKQVRRFPSSVSAP